MNPAAWVERHARRRPGDPALAEGDRVHASWSEFAARTARAAACAISSAWRRGAGSRS